MATAPKAAAKPGAKGAPLQAVPAADEAPETVGMSRKKKIIILLVALMALTGGGFAAWKFFEQKAAANNPAQAKAPEAKPPVFLNIESFTVNLQADGGDQFLQTSFTLQVKEAAHVDLIKLYLPQVRSRLLLLLSGKRADEIFTPEGKKKLAGEIASKVNEPFAPGLPRQTVTDVFFTSFVIQ